MVKKSKLNLSKKWLKNTIYRYKHKNQRKEDLNLIISGFTKFASAIYSLCKILYNVVYKLFAPNAHKSEPVKVPLALIKAFSGMCIIIVSPVLVVRIVLRMFFTLMSMRSNSVFLNNGLKKIINEHKNHNTLESQDIISDTLTKLEIKSAKYLSNEQKDSIELDTILKKPQLLAYQKVDAIRVKIHEKEDEEAKRIEEANKRNDDAIGAVMCVNL